MCVMQLLFRACTTLSLLHEDVTPLSNYLQLAFAPNPPSLLIPFQGWIQKFCKGGETGGSANHTLAL